MFPQSESRHPHDRLSHQGKEGDDKGEVGADDVDDLDDDDDDEEVGDETVGEAVLFIGRSRRIRNFFLVDRSRYFSGGLCRLARSKSSQHCTAARHARRPSYFLQIYVVV